VADLEAGVELAGAGVSGEAGEGVGEGGGHGGKVANYSPCLFSPQHPCHLEVGYAITAWMTMTVSVSTAHSRLWPVLSALRRARIIGANRRAVLIVGSSKKTAGTGYI
jgi:hypothetical protein